MILQGKTLFLGDSLTLGASSLVQCAEPSKTIAEVNKSTSWMLEQLRAFEPYLSSYARLVVLGGTNDIAGSSSADQIFKNLTAIYQIGQAHKLHVVANLVPPFKGWPSFNASFDAFNDKRKALNRLIFLSADTNEIVDLDELVREPQDFDKLSTEADSGDHLHIKKPVLAKIWQSQLARMQNFPTIKPEHVPTIEPRQRPDPGAPGEPPPARVDLAPLVLVGAAVALGYFAWKNRRLAFVKP